MSDQITSLQISCRVWFENF